jgi:uncharacterized membrane protein HdeD (DUF308 family)
MSAMTAALSDLAIETLAPKWWAFVVRGLLALVFGVLAFAMPAATVSALVLVFGLFALFDGLLALGASVPAAYARLPWWPLVLRGLLGLAAAWFALARPEATVVVAVYLIALWAIVGGALEIVTAVQYREAIPHAWLLVVGGAAAIVFGVLAVGAPQAGELALVWVLGVYALVAGVVWLVFGVRLFGEHRRAAAAADQRPPAATPAPGAAA